MIVSSRLLHVAVFAAAAPVFQGIGRRKRHRAEGRGHERRAGIEAVRPLTAPEQQLLLPSSSGRRNRREPVMMVLDHTGVAAGPAARAVGPLGFGGGSGALVAAVSAALPWPVVVVVVGVVARVKVFTFIVIPSEKSHFFKTTSKIPKFFSKPLRTGRRGRITLVPIQRGSRRLVIGGSLLPVVWLTLAALPTLPVSSPVKG